MMGDRNVKCVSTLLNDNKGEIHQTESIRNVNGISMYMLKSLKLNCEMNCCIEIV